jgi:hypothetical protein
MTTKISVYNLDSSITNAITTGGGPKIQTIVYPGNDTAVNTAGGDTVFLNGSNFVTGCSVVVNGNTAGSVTFNSSSNVAFTAPAAATGGYPIYLVNPDGGTAIAVPGLQYSGVPTWSTAAGSLGSVYETTAFANTVVASGDAQITYSVYSGSLPTGASLNSLSGTISGNSVATASSTTYNFTIRATDAQQQDSDRAFSLTVNPDVVTWSSPANNVTYTLEQLIPMSNVTLAATSAAGYGVQYAANTLPTGLTVSGNTISGTPSTVQSINTLVTATSNTTSRTAQQIINWVVNVGADPYFPYVNTLLSANTAVMPFNDDASTNNFNVAITGDTKPSNWNPYQSGYYSNFFDGTGDYLKAPYNVAFDFGTGNFTVECWTYYISGDISFFAGDATGSTDCAYLTNSFRFGRYNTAWDTTISYTLTANQWYHIAFIKESGVAKVYVNGVLIGSAANANSYNAAGGNSSINTAGDGSRQGSNYMSNLRVVKGTAVYTGAFTPPTTPLTAISGTSLLTCQSNRFIDNSTNNFTISRFGDARISSLIPYTPATSYATYGSTYFDGSGDYLTTPTSTSFGFGTGTFTFETWVYPTSNPANGPGTVIDCRSGTNAEGWVVRIFNNLTIGIYDGPNNIYVNSTGTVTLNAWNHIAIVRSNTSSGGVAFYINGAASGTGTIASNLGTTWVARIGSNYTASYDYFGYMSDLRVIKSTALYTGAFTPPTIPLTAVANTSLLTCQSNQPVNNNVFVDNSTNNSLVTRNGNTTQGTFSPYGENYSVFFDGTGDSLSLPCGDYINYGTGDFTVEFWINTKGSGGLFAPPSTVLTTAWDFSISGGNFLWRNRYTATTVWSYSAAGVTDGLWHHVAIARQSSSSRFFIDGSLVATNTDSTNWDGNESSKTFTIGSSGLGDFTGYLSNVRFVKGIALYTSAFTPSTSPLQPINGYTNFLICQSNRFIDNSASNRTLTRNGDASVQKFGPFGQVTLPTPYYGAYFDGTGDYLTLPSNAAFNLNATFTAECWVYVTSLANDMGVWFNGTFGGDDNRIQLAIRTTGRIDVYAVNTGVQNYFPQSNTGVISVNTWYHTAVVSNGSTVTLYVNGTSVASSSITGTPPTVNTFYVGYARASATDKTMVGYISNFRIVKGTAVYTAAFTPPTSTLTAISNTSLLTCQSATLIDNSSSNLTLTANGDSKPTRFNPFTLSYSLRQIYSPSVYGGSMYLDGTGDYVLIPDNTNFTFSGDFTIECWAYPKTSGAATGFISKRANDSTAYGGINVDLSSLTPSLLASTTGSSWAITNGTSSIPLVLNSWNHFAITRSGTTVNMWVNGIKGYTATLSGALNNSTASWALGARAANGPGTLFTGYIGDFRVTNGQSLYTSNFAPPQAPVSAVKGTTALLSGATGGIIDSSGITQFETLGDAKLNSAFTKFTGATSIALDGTGDYLLSAPSPNLEFGSGDFTIEFWWYPISTSRQALYHGSFGTDWSVGIDYSGPGTQKMGIWASSNGTSWNLINADSGGNGIGTTTVTQNAWNHIAYVRNGTTWMLFVNGNRDLNLTAISGTIISRATSQKAIGAWWSTGSIAQASGYISDFRISKYARYTATFTPTTTAFKQF